MKKTKSISLVSSSLLALLLVPRFAFALVAGGCGTACINMGADHSLQEVAIQDLYPYLWRQLLLVAAFYISGFIFGKLVQRGKMSPSLSRKLVCVLTFVVSFANSFSVPAYGISVTCVLVGSGCVIILAMLSSLALPLRRKFAVLQTVFSAINRPEDEPYTLGWLATEAVVTGVVIIAFIPVIHYFSNRSLADQDIIYGLMLMPVFASGIGDALAEIVGKRWGKHFYSTRSITGNRVYMRSYEGSFMVFVTTVAAGLIVAAQFHFELPVFYWKAFILLPFTLTLAEAKAPHTWDNPLLYLAGYATIVLCLL
ncbi:MAG: hypothetical protein JWM96_1421 [Alphaproteobacteria bacterium]|nr:hypothetical protein [Alphaproteobacteria bacterium]